MHGLGQHDRDSVKTRPEIRRQTDETLLHNCIRKGKWATGTKYAEYTEYTKYAEYAEYAEYEEYEEYAKNTQKIREPSFVYRHLPFLYAHPFEYNKYA